MPYISDWVVETASAPGVGNVTLAGHLAGPFIRFQDAFGASGTVFYTISDETSQRETGIGTLSTSTTLSRDTVLHNTAGTQPTKLNFTTAVTVWCAIPAASAVFVDTNSLVTVPNLAVTTAMTIGGVTVPHIEHGQLGGLGLSNDGTSPNTVLDIASGTCTDSTNASFIDLPTFTKTIGGTWVAGSGNNGLRPTTVAASTWYHVFAATISGTSDVFFDTSPTAANAPGGTTAFRRVGSFLTTGASAIRAFLQQGDEFLWSTALNNLSTGTLGTTPLNVVLDTPLGVRTDALVTGRATAANAGSFLMQCPDITQQAANSPAGNNTTTWAAGVQAGFFQQVRTDASSSVNVVSTQASTTVNLVTQGYIDRRGRA